MTAQLDRLPSIHTIRARERRREPRYPTNCPVCLYTGGARLGAVWLVDVSPHGCCIHSPDLEIRAGVFVALGARGTLPAAAEPPLLEAIVRWVRANAAGLEFLHSVPDDARFWQDLIDNGPSHGPGH